MNPTIYTIGKLAQAAGVNIETIRYYQRIGLITEPPRPASGYRLYPSDTVDRLHFIQRAKELGFTLVEIAELLKLDQGNCKETRDLALHKLEAIQGRIRDLESMQKVLQALVDSCKDTDTSQACPIIQALSDKD